jgi:hypothetical protein
LEELVVDLAFFRANGRASWLQLAMKLSMSADGAEGEAVQRDVPLKMENHLDL